MIRTFFAKDNAVYRWGADVDWRSTQHLGNMLRDLIKRNVDFFHNYGTFYFKHERDRTLFMLRWAGVEELH